MTGRRLARFAVLGAWLGVVALCVGFAAMTRLGPVIIIQGGSMEPALATGSVAMLGAANRGLIAPGAVVTVRAPNDVLVTHRIVRVVDLPSGTHLELKGDANPRPDPVLVPIESVEGVLQWSTPHIGYVAALFQTPLGLLSVFSALLAGGLALALLGPPATAARVAVGP